MRWLVVLVLLLPMVALAQPSPTAWFGTAERDSSVTITGSGFGSKIPVSPEVWTRWENAGAADGDPVEDDVAEHGWRTSDDAPTYDTFEYCTDFNRDGGQYNVRVLCPGPINGNESRNWIVRKDLDIELGDKMFFMLYVRSNWTGAKRMGVPVDDAPVAWKMWRFGYDPAAPGNDGNLPYPVFQYIWEACGSEIPPGCMRLKTLHDPSGSGFEHTLSGGTTAYPDTTLWWSQEFQVELASGRNTFDGTTETWFLQEGGSWSVHSTANGMNNADSDDHINPMYNGVAIDRYGRGANNAYGMGHDRYHMHFDDVVLDYGDDAWARVMLGNAATWNGCTRREYQLATSWAAGTITVTFNPGASNPDDVNYLYIVDSDGNYNSNGLAVTIGGESSGGDDTTPPTVEILSIQPMGDDDLPNPFQLHITGSASDNIAVQSVTWTSSAGGSGSASGTDSWVIDGVYVNAGLGEVITITARDVAGNSSQVELAVDEDMPGPVSTPQIQ